jgi:porin
MKRLLRLARQFVVALAVLGAPAAAVAQPEVFNPTPNLGGAIAPSPLIGTALEPMVHLGQDLYAAGVLPRLRYVQSAAGNPIGGLSQGTDTSGVVIFGGDFDLDKIAHIPGSVIHVGFAQFYGHELSTDHIGSRTKVQSFYYPKKQFELSEFTLEQSLFNQQLNIIVGRANATGEFARSTYGCRFQNVADCPYEMTQAIGGFPGFPYVNWGGRVRYNPTPAVFIKAGAYETNSVRNSNSGFEWGLAHSTGYVIPVEAGYATDFTTDSHPRHFTLGGWYNSADYTDPYLNTKEKSRGLVGGKPLPHGGGRVGLYALADQVVYRYDEDSQRNLALFASAGGPRDAAELFAFQSVAGFIWTGPFASRPEDQIGLLNSFIRLSNKEDGYINALLTKAHSTSFVSRNQFIFEVNYNYQVISGLYLAGSLQYIVNPDPISRPSATFAPKDALVLGLKLALNMNEMLSLPSNLRAH